MQEEILLDIEAKPLSLLKQFSADKKLSLRY